jgi:hypothetical protein
MHRRVVPLAIALLAIALGAGACQSPLPLARSGELVEAAADNLAALLTDARAKLAELAAVPDVREGDAAACHSSVRARVPPLGPYTAFGRADGNGALYCISTPDAAPIDVSDRLYFQRAMSSGDFAVGNYQIGRATFMESIGFGYPVLKDGRIDGIVLAPLDLDKLDERLAAIALPDGAELVVIDSTGTVVAQRPNADRWIGTPAADVPLVQQMLAAETGEGSLAGVDGAARAYSWRAVQGSAGNLRVAVGVPN